MARQRIASESARRDGLLLSGTEKEIRACEAGLRDAELMVERLNRLHERLSTDLSTACGEEQLAHVAGLRAEAERATQAFAAWWRDSYAPLAREIANGLAPETAARRARFLFEQTADTARVTPTWGRPAGSPRLSCQGCPWRSPEAALDDRRPC